MKQSVHVVTNPELGWDCVVGVYDADIVKMEDLLEEFPEGDYVITTEIVEVCVD